MSCLEVFWDAALPLAVCWEHLTLSDLFIWFLMISLQQYIYTESLSLEERIDSYPEEEEDIDNENYGVLRISPR